MKWIISFVLFGLGIIINKKRDQKKDEKASNFSLCFAHGGFSPSNHKRYESIMQQVYRSSFDSEGKYNPEIWKSTMNPIAQYYYENFAFMQLEIYKHLSIPAHYLKINIKSSCLPYQKVTGMNIENKTLGLKQYSQREYTELKTEAKQYENIEIEITYNYNGQAYRETHFMQGDGQIIFGRKKKL